MERKNCRQCEEIGDDKILCRDIIMYVCIVCGNLERVVVMIVDCEICLLPRWHYVVLDGLLWYI